MALDQDNQDSNQEVSEQVALGQHSNQGRVVSEQVVSEQEDLDLRQDKVVSEQVDLGQQDRAITMVGLVEIFNKSIR